MKKKKNTFGRRRKARRNVRKTKMRWYLLRPFAHEQHRIIYERLNIFRIFGVLVRVLRNLLLIYVNHLNIVYPLKDTTGCTHAVDDAVRHCALLTVLSSSSLSTFLAECTSSVYTLLWLYGFLWRTISDGIFRSICLCLKGMRIHTCERERKQCKLQSNERIE